MRVGEAVERAFKFGMYQHRNEILPFAHWLAPRWPHHVVEIGGLHGGTSTLWGALATGIVVSIDLPAGEFGGAAFGYTEEKCLARNAKLKELVPTFVGVLGNSHDREVVARVESILREPACMLFVDGDHTYEGVRQDYEMYRHLVRPGGCIVFHDINDTPFHHSVGCHVDRLWRELAGEKLEFTINASWGGIGVLRV